MPCLPAASAATSLLQGVTGAYPGCVPHSAVLPPTRARTRRRVLAELSLGLLLGIVGGWLAGLLRVRRP